MNFQIEPVTAKGVFFIFGNTPSKGQLMKLCENKIVVPFIDSTGQGTTRMFDFKNLMEVAIWRVLHGIGVNNGTIRYAVNRFRNDSSSETQKSYLVLTYFPVESSDKQSSTAYHSVDFWTGEEFIRRIEGKKCHGIIPDMPSGLMVINLDAIRKHLISFFWNNGKLMRGE